MPIAKITVDNNVRECTKFSYRVMQSVDYSSGRPATNVAPLEITASFFSEASDVFFGLCIDPTKKVKGSIEIMDPEDKNKPLKTLNFEEAVVTTYTEAGSGISNSEVEESITIIARIADVNNNSKHEVQWKRS